MAVFCRDQRPSEYFSTSEALKTTEVVMLFCGLGYFHAHFICV